MKYHVIVIGAGHAGCEAALAAGRKGLSTLLVTLHPDSIAQMSCNPAIGGTAKGQIVREIDALGGEMAKVTDCAGLQFRMLNLSRGPAVWSPRAQCDKRLYHGAMKSALESQENLDVLQAEAAKILVKNNRAAGIETRTGLVIEAGAVIVTTGTFMRGLIHVGMSHFPGGRFNEPSAESLSASLERECGLEIKRLKTGTPPRINGRSIDFAAMERQPGDEPPAPFSHFTDAAAWQKTKRQLPCWLTYTNTETHRIIRDNLDRSPLYCGIIKSAGPRYCPSIEDKVVRFSHRDRHQVFLEPEGYDTQEFYANGISTSLPQDVQQGIVHSIKGLENAKIMRYGYAIEYDYCPPTQLYPTLETKTVENLFLAGQVNGTTGYEEAAGLGLIAGINAANKLQNSPPFVLRRDEAYLGVLVDDLVTKGVDEPYRMFTARAEYRLMLRSDNADLRLMEHGRRLGLICEEFYRRFEAYRAALAEYGANKSISVSDDELLPWTLAHVRRQAELERKYSGYIARQVKQAGNLRKMENKTIPASIDYGGIPGLLTETREKFQKVRPMTLGQAARIPGVTPADVALLSIHLKALKKH
ncbi:MAG: tRNA uridine-5-carboxymethylaminomethyl(34) synthesis enzyme MnmG [Elusimicrobia bacterium RIFOXYB2_FULL_50_12]|nr:MAG: tRNA uridine-5-carboxymethylaminomethyl(34) synthesis enzyme MnmG [Elusimicrobia bacterium RIFOXYB2_FULL_50_12]